MIFYQQPVSKYILKNHDKLDTLQFAGNYFMKKYDSLLDD